MERKIKILGIAPYEGMKSIMQNIAGERDDIELDVFVGDLEKGVAIARQNYENNYDVIISRGGTAELIGMSTHIPVIEVTLSVYDILRAIKLAENYAERYAIVGFPAITAGAHLLCDLLQLQIDIFTIHDTEEVTATLKELKKKGYRMVVCDMIANTTAKRLGLNAILITSGNESIAMAFDQAVKLSSSYATIKAQNAFLQDVIAGANQQTVVLKDDGSIFYSTLPEGQITVILNEFREELPGLLDNQTEKFFKNIDGVLYSIVCRRLRFRAQDYMAFYFTTNSLPINPSKNGIRYLNLEEVEERSFNRFYNVASAGSGIRSAIESLNQSNVPVMLLGEPGSGKEQAAHTIYAQGLLHTAPLITIDCSLLDDRSWNLITNHYNSPFNDNRNTIYIRDITALPDNRRRQLLSLIIDTNLCKRNRLIMSCICLQDTPVPEEVVEFINQLACVTVYLPPLREKPEELPTLSSLYLNMLNVSMTNQIIGFEADAMKNLQDYSWPYNYTQFERILNELAMITTTPYIRNEHVSMLLSKERKHITPAVPDTKLRNAGAARMQLPLDRTLDEINQEIIRLTLEQCGGNQSATAKKLGISRTTLWRLLK